MAWGVGKFREEREGKKEVCVGTGDLKKESRDSFLFYHLERKRGRIKGVREEKVAMKGGNGEEERKERAGKVEGRG